ncbi:MAG: Do family serine endopeptidase [Bacteroidetes bacterium]|nr:Do family serine endopeptidase [Bacteroidota bacterium]
MEPVINKNKFLTLALAGLLGGVVSLGGYALLAKKTGRSIENLQNASGQLARYASLNTVPAFDFTGVSSIATPAVVHIKTTVGTQQPESGRGGQQPMDPFEFFNGPGGGFRFENPGPRQASGSGVILSDDGYIVTNNHVVEGATKIEVVLNDKRTYVAELIGTDKNTDIALIRIPESNLPFLKLGNSDDVKVGQWTVAVGNPFNLNSTVTLGIVSAVGRNIDLIRSHGNKYAIENFIQTDAAINPGNSGGALVSVAGELIGINTAIASETGSYAGYAFAVPVNLVKKVVNDLMKYGKVQRGLLGVSIQEINQQLADEKGLSDLKGVYVAEVVQNSAAEKAGIKKGDVILKINGTEVNSSSRLQEEVGKNKPGDKVTVTLRRKGDVKDVEATLLSEDGKTKLEVAEKSSSETYLGLKLTNTTREERMKLTVKNGVKVEEVGNGVFKDAGVPKDMTITHINNEPVYSAQGAIAALKNLKGAITIEGKTVAGAEKVIAVKLPAKAQDEE